LFYNTGIVKSWSPSREIYGDPAAYSDLVVQKDKNIGVLCEKNDYTKIVYAFFSYD
jgi:sialidase-1